MSGSSFRGEACTRRGFLGLGALAAGGCLAPARAAAPCKFIFMADHHVESDFVQSFGADRGKPVYTCWRPGDHAALVRTYAFINDDPFCRDARLAIFGGDQINTGYLSHAADRDAELANYHRTLGALDLYRTSKGTDVSDLKFTSVPSFVCRGNLARGQSPVTFACPPPDSRVIAIQGNHDTGVGAFYRECAFQCGDTRFITFFASYCGLPAPKGQYRSTGVISDGALAFIEREMAAAAADPAIRHIVLVSHWAIAPKSADFVCPIVDACAANRMNGNRARLLALAERYGCDLYLNGHEHNGAYPVGRAGVLHDVNCGSLTDEKGAWSVVEMLPDRALVHVYSRAAAEERDGRVVFTRLPRRLFTREVPVRPLHA